jgi:hypothetical protein
VTDTILEAAAETERLDEEEKNLQAEGEQTKFVFETETSATSEIPSQDTEGVQLDELTDDVSESAVDVSVGADKPTETKAKLESKAKAEPKAKSKPKADPKVKAKPKTKTRKKTKPNDKTNLSSDIESSLAQTDTEILKDAAKTEKLEEEVKGLQAEDEQTVVVAEAETSDTIEISGKDTAGVQEDELTDDMPESVVKDAVDVAKPTEEIGDLQADKQADEPTVIDTENSDTEILTESTEATEAEGQVAEVTEATEGVETRAEVVEGSRSEDEQKDVIVETEGLDIEESLIQEQAAELTDDMPESVVDNVVDVEKPTEEIDDLQTDKQADILVETENTGIADSVIQEADELTEDVTESVIESAVEAESSTEKADDAIEDDQAGEITETTEAIAAEDSSGSKSIVARIKKAGIIISVFIVFAAVILLLVASVERKSAKKTLVQVNKVAASIKQMREETLEEREQVTLSQIEGRELIIDALLLTRNGLELERANTEEVEVKRIIGIFINDIDERVTKIKGNIALLRNKLKEAD